MASGSVDAVTEPIFDFANCDKMESVTRDKRSRFSAGQKSSGYSSADMSDFNDGTPGKKEPEFGSAEPRQAGCQSEYGASIARNANDSSDSSSSSSDSDSSDEEKNEEDEYRVERRDQRVLRSQRSQQPPLYSPISTLCEENRFVPSTDFDDVIKNDSTGEMVDENIEEKVEVECAGVHDGSETVEHLPSGYEIMKRKTAYLKLSYGVDFCKIQTVKYRHHHKKFIQHYKKNLRPEEKDIEGNIGLREGDLLVEVNGKPLIDRKQKRIVEIFEKIKPKHHDGNIYITLRFRRWEKRKTGGRELDYEVDYELKLVLEPVFPYETECEHSLERGVSVESGPSDTEEREDEDKLASRGPVHSHTSRTRRSRFKYRVSSEETVETNTTLLPKGNIDGIQPRGERLKARIKYTACGPDEYLTVNTDDTLYLSVPLPASADNEVFSLEEFIGVDTSPEHERLSPLIYCVRIQASAGGGKFVSSQLEKEDVAMCLKTSVPKVKSSNDVDETCFIRREFGRSVLLESLLFRGNFIGCETKDGKTFKLKMVKKSLDDLINDNNLGDAKFEIFYTSNESVDNLREHHHGTIEKLVKRFAVFRGNHPRNELVHE